MIKRVYFAILIIVLCSGFAVVGTMAWLFAKSEVDAATYTVGQINIALSESNSGLDGSSKGFLFVPGEVIACDSEVIVLPGSEACYLFVSVEERGNVLSGLDGKIVEWDVNSSVVPGAGWMAVPGHDGFWYQEVDAVPKASIGGERFTILTHNANYPKGFITANAGLTKEMISKLNNNHFPMITFSAAAVQKDYIGSVDAAWNLLPDSFVNS